MGYCHLFLYFEVKQSTRWGDWVWLPELLSSYHSSKNQQQLWGVSISENQILYLFSIKVPCRTTAVEILR